MTWRRMTLVMFAIVPGWLAAAEPQLALPGKLVYELPAGVLPADWKGYGDQTLVQGEWQISERASDNHMAAPKVLTPAQNLIADFEWRTLTASRMAFRCDVRTGHLCNVSWTAATESVPAKLVLGLQDYDRDAGPATGQIFDSRECAWKPGEWIKVRWEMLGDELLVRAGSHQLYGQHKALAITKTTLAFPVTGGAAQVRALKIWEALPNPAWPAQAEVVRQGVNRAGQVR